MIVHRTISVLFITGGCTSPRLSQHTKYKGYIKYARGRTITQRRPVTYYTWTVTEMDKSTEQQNVTILTETTDSLNKLTRAPGEIRLAENTETRK